MKFVNRRQAGERLGQELLGHAGESGLLVLALPRGGVPVAAQVAAALHAPLDLLVVRKVGVPGSPEVALGAVASGGTVVINPAIARGAGLTEDELLPLVQQARREVEKRELAYRGSLAPPAVSGRRILLVDDGLATGATMMAGVRALRKMGAARVMVAAPVGSREALESLGREADEVVCLLIPEPFMAVGCHYEDFCPVSDREVSSWMDLCSR